MAGFRRIANLFRRSRLDREIGEELQAHIEMRIEDNLARGMSPAEARREALVRFGSPVATKERVAGSDVNLGLENAWRDVRYAARHLRRSPGFALTAIVTLALGVGANVVVFGVLNALLLRPLDVAQPEKVVQIVNQRAGDDNQSYPDFEDLRSRNSTFADMAVFRPYYLGLSAGGSAARAWDYEVSSNYFDMLGVQPELGRFFHASDERGANSMPYAVLSDALWRTKFGANPQVVGTTVELSKHPFQVIGVAPPTFNGTEVFLWPDLWIPIVNEQQVEGFDLIHQRSSRGLFVIGRLKDGVSAAQATEDLASVDRQLAKEYPATNDGAGKRLVKPGLMGDTLGGPARPFLMSVMALALLVLVAACVNLAGIFTARAAERKRELAIRLSIGSTRARIMRQLLTEALLVAISGGVCGTLAALGLLRVLSQWQPIADLPIHVSVTPDGRVFAIALLLTLASAILPGLLPARQVWSTDAMQAMKSTAPAPLRGLRFSLRDVLLGVQITVCALLVTASLVAVRGMERSLHAPLGFVPQNATVVRLDMKLGGYTADSAGPVQRRILEEAERLPGVTAAGVISNLPLSAGNDNWTVYREGTTEIKPANAVASPHAYIVSPGYLAAAQTRLLAGRTVSWDDKPKNMQVAVVNQKLARLLFGTDPAVGRRFVLGDKSECEVVGVVEDGKYSSLTESGDAAMFFSLSQMPTPDSNLVVRTERASETIVPELTMLMRNIDASLPVMVEPWSRAMALALFPARVATAALGVMGLLASLLAVTGIFGMATYTVSRRLRDLGIRMALGARRMEVMRSALARPVVLLAAGSGLGLLLGMAASRVLAAVVYTATIRDPLVLTGALLLMVLVGLAATWIPARRALGVNPAQLLRED